MDQPAQSAAAGQAPSAPPASPLDALSPEQRLRYYLFTRSRVSPDAVATMLSGILPPSAVLDDSTVAYPGERSQDMLWALSGAAKAFAVEVAEQGETRRRRRGAASTPTRRCVPLSGGACAPAYTVE